MMTAKKTNLQIFPLEMPLMPGLNIEADFPALTNRQTGLLLQDEVSAESSQKLVTDDSGVHIKTPW